MTQASSSPQTTEPQHRKPVLWLLIADLERPDLPLVVPSVAGLAQEAGVLLECYFESARDGKLFARTGSTVLGGHHHQQFNYLHAVFDVRAILLGATALFDSSLATFRTPVLARTDSTVDLYRTLLAAVGRETVDALVVAPGEAVTCGERRLEIGPYLFPDIFFRQALAIAPRDVEAARGLLARDGALLALLVTVPGAQNIDTVAADDSYASLTTRVVARWQHKAKGVVFGDPPAVLSQLASHCQHARVALFGPKTVLPPAAVRFSSYTEETSEVATEVARVAEEIGNRVIVGRQTGDGDLFEWSKHGVCIQIIDPNRPAFPVVETVPHPWKQTAAGPFDGEPSDAQLHQWAEERRVLTTLIWHSGEVAHNEAMLNLCELAGTTGVKMGIGVHAERYETCPQLWELLNVPPAKGGVQGLIEPVLHSGGMGVLAECNCPTARLREHMAEALGRIRRIAGERSVPRGYYAFMDSDLATLSSIREDVFAAVEDAGLEYFVSSAVPGRNRVLRMTPRSLAFNQSCRVVHGASPFVRITTAADLETAGSTSPAWLIAALDAPVIAFAPYIWRHGTHFMQVVDALRAGNRINVTPHTVARYARMLVARGCLASQ